MYMFRIYMTNRTAKISIIVIVVAVVAVFAIYSLASRRSYSKELVNGFHLRCVRGEFCVITTPEHFRRENTNADVGTAIGPEVTKYAIVDSLIIGSVEDALLPSLRGMTQPGYFIIDTRTGRTISGLDYQSWRRHLDDVNAALPRLRAP